MTAVDLVVVGGGLGGAALALAMARRGWGVQVLERETRFRDRVRGEGMHPWGVAEARALGIDKLLLGKGGRELALWTMRFGEMVRERHLPSTTKHGAGVYSFSHPLMQETLLEAAAAEGAEVRRGAIVRGITPGNPARVVFDCGGAGGEASARLVVVANGRASEARRSCGLTIRNLRPRLRVAGALLDAPGVPSDTVTSAIGDGRVAINFPRGADRVRTYVAWHTSVLDERFAGSGALSAMVAESVVAGALPEWYQGARVVGPLATFAAAASWVETPCAPGVVLIGDAATTTDPAWGQGLSLTLRDVRVLADELTQSDDIERACQAYAAVHHRYATTLLTAEDWYTDLLLEPGPAALARREHALMAASADSSRMPDVFHAGPDIDLDEAARRRFFGD